jgi:hypothetical protein
MTYRRITPDLIAKAQQQILERIKKRFPEAGLVQVTEELGGVIGQATDRAEGIRRPNLPLRIGVGVFILVATVVFVMVASALKVRTNLTDVVVLVEFAEAATGTLLIIGAAVLSLLSLETRWKRRRALAAIHELRVLAHIVDMHQISKQPEGIMPGDKPDEAQTTKTLFELNRYLNYCLELLAVISKVAALYIQDVPDTVAVSAVDSVESLCGGLSNKIWQKLQSFDRPQNVTSQ